MSEQIDQNAEKTLAVKKGRPKFPKGNKCAVGHGGWKCRSWSKILQELFELIHDNPDELERVTGMKLSENMRHKDAQLLLAFTELMRSLSGRTNTSGEFKRWLHGDPTQTLNVQGKSFAELITEAYNNVSSAKGKKANEPG